MSKQTFTPAEIKATLIDLEATDRKNALVQQANELKYFRKQAEDSVNNSGRLVKDSQEYADKVKVIADAFEASGDYDAFREAKMLLENETYESRRCR